jgi:orotidine-5'-phosphate decarboxylase
MRARIDPPVCIALDVDELDDARRIVDLLADRVRVFKVGLQLFTSVGPAAIGLVHSSGRDVFLDLKVNDIPNTAVGAVRAAARHGVRFLTIHSSGGREMLRAAVEAAGDDGPRLLVVSALTSLDDDALHEIGIAKTASEHVAAMAELAVGAGAPGLVLGAAEVARTHAAYADLFLLVPGMRPAWAATGDQRRTGTPAQAVADGADLIVLGRAVTASDDPADALTRVLDEIDEGVSANR